MTSDDKKKNIFGLIGDAAETINEIAEENEELIDRMSQALSKDGQTVEISDQDPLTQLEKTSDKVIIGLEVPGGDFADAAISHDRGVVAIEVDGKVFRANVPDDVDLEGLEYSFSNGVLDITIPRTEDRMGTVEVINSDNEGEEMEEPDDGPD